MNPMNLYESRSGFVGVFMDLGFMRGPMVWVLESLHRVGLGLQVGLHWTRKLDQSP